MASKPDNDSESYDDAGDVMQAALEVLDEFGAVVIDTGVSEYTITQSDDLWGSEEGHDHVWVAMEDSLEPAGVAPQDVEAIRAPDRPRELVETVRTILSNNIGAVIETESESIMVRRKTEVWIEEEIDGSFWATDDEGIHRVDPGAVQTVRPTTPDERSEANDVRRAGEDALSGVTWTSNDGVQYSTEMGMGESRDVVIGLEDGALPTDEDGEPLNPLREPPNDDAVVELTRTVEALVGEHGLPAVYSSLEKVDEDVEERIQDLARGYAIEHTDVPIGTCPECDSDDVEGADMDARGMVGQERRECQCCGHSWKAPFSKVVAVERGHVSEDSGGGTA